MHAPSGSTRHPLAVILIAAVMALAACSSSATGGSSATPSSPPGASAPTAAASGTGAVRSIPVGVGTPPLTGTLTLPAASGPVPAVVLVSGSGPNDQDETVGDDKSFLDLADGLAAHGIASVRYDKRTHDYPTGINVASFTPYDEYVPDALAAINLLRSRSEIDPHRIFLLGHSQGGTLAPLIAKNAPELAGVILAAASAEPTQDGIVRQDQYLSTLPGTIGADARTKLAADRRVAQAIDSPRLADDSPTTILDGAAPAYWLWFRQYDEVATARSLPQPLLFLQGDRDYNVTVPQSLDVWLNGLAGRPGLTAHQYPQADHEFIDGTGPATPADYAHPSHVDDAVITDIATWITTTGTGSTSTGTGTGTGT